MSDPRVTDWLPGELDEIETPRDWFSTVALVVVALVAAAVALYVWRDLHPDPYRHITIEGGIECVEHGDAIACDFGDEP